MADLDDIFRWLSEKRWRPIWPSYKRMIDRLVIQGRAEYCGETTLYLTQNGKRVPFRLPKARVKASHG